MSLRVIGGAWKGRRLAAPDGRDTRPLLDRIKQSLFDRLGQSCDGWHVIDVCAGSGAFGIEAASRGAERVDLIECAAAACKAIDANLELLKRPPALRLHRGRFQDVLPRLDAADVVWCDPPFPWYREDPEQLTAMLSLAATRLAPDGMVLVRGERGVALPLVAALREDDRWQYGRSWVARLIPT